MHSVKISDNIYSNTHCLCSGGQVQWLDPDPHQSDKLNPEPDLHQLADDKQKCMEYKPIRALFRGFWAFIWKLGTGSGSASKWKVGSGYASKWQAESGSASKLQAESGSASKWHAESGSASKWQAGSGSDPQHWRVDHSTITSGCI